MQTFRERVSGEFFRIIRVGQRGRSTIFLAPYLSFRGDNYLVREKTKGHR